MLIHGVITKITSEGGAILSLDAGHKGVRAATMITDRPTALVRKGDHVAIFQFDSEFDRDRWIENSAEAGYWYRGGQVHWLSYPTDLQPWD